MTNSEIETRLAQLVREERAITGEILSLIREAEVRKLFLERGFPNLYEWLVRGFGYSHGAAHRRIQAARLVQAVPAVAEKLKEGALNLTTAAQLQSTLKREERRTGECFSPGEKQTWIGRIEGKSAPETERLLAEAFPEAVGRKEIFKPVSGDASKVTLVLESDAVEALRRVRELLSHTLPEASMAEIVAHLAKQFVKEKDPLEKSAADKRRVKIFQKSQSRCEYRDPKTGRICGSRWRVEMDHKLPRALGGKDEKENFRCLCRAHNQLERERFLGSEINYGNREKRAVS